MRLNWRVWEVVIERRAEDRGAKAGWLLETVKQKIGGGGSTVVRCLDCCEALGCRHELGAYEYRI